METAATKNVLPADVLFVVDVVNDDGTPATQRQSRDALATLLGLLQQQPRRIP